MSTDNEFEFEFSTFTVSPPYHERRLAARDARDPRLLKKANGFDIDILECRRACPRSHFGRFGWDDDEDETHRWWEDARWPGDYS